MLNWLTNELVTIQITFLVIAFLVVFLLKHKSPSSLEFAIKKAASASGLPVAAFVVVAAYNPELISEKTELLRLYVAFGGLCIGWVSLTALIVGSGTEDKEPRGLPKKYPSKSREDDELPTPEDAAPVIDQDEPMPPNDGRQDDR